MIKIDWNQIKSLKLHLLREGFTENTDVMLMIFFQGEADSKKIKTTLGKLDKVLFDAVANPLVSGVFLFDADVKRPLWRIKEQNKTSVLETAPSSGHHTIIRDFLKMSHEERDVWLDITLASAMHHMETHKV